MRTLMVFEFLRSYIQKNARSYTLMPCVNAGHFDRGRRSWNPSADFDFSSHQCYFLLLFFRVIFQIWFSERIPFWMPIVFSFTSLNYPHSRQNPFIWKAVKWLISFDNTLFTYTRIQCSAYWQDPMTSNDCCRWRLGRRKSSGNRWGDRAMAWWQLRRWHCRPMASTVCAVPSLGTTCSYDRGSGRWCGGDSGWLCGSSSCSTMMPSAVATIGIEVEGGHCGSLSRDRYSGGQCRDGHVASSGTNGLQQVAPFLRAGHLLLPIDHVCGQCSGATVFAGYPFYLQVHLKLMSSKLTLPQLEVIVSCLL